MRERTTRDFVGAIVGNVVAIAFVNTVPLCSRSTVGVITDRWVDILWAANLSLLVQIVGNFLLLYYRPPRFQAFMRAAFSAVEIVSLAVFYAVFPLDFSRLVGEWMNTFMRVLLVVAMVASLAAGAVQLVRFLTGGWGAEKRE